jgi:hypothetical protein
MARGLRLPELHTRSGPDIKRLELVASPEGASEDELRTLAEAAAIIARG